MRGGSVPSRKRARARPTNPVRSAEHRLSSRSARRVHPRESASAAERGIRSAASLSVALGLARLRQRAFAALATRIGHSVRGSRAAWCGGFHYRLRLAESPCDEILKERRNPCAAWSPEIAREAFIWNVLDSHLESRGQPMARSLVRHPFDFESKIRGRKSEANNFCGER